VIKKISNFDFRIDAEDEVPIRNSDILIMCPVIPGPLRNDRYSALNLLDANDRKFK
jgi:hypothetical protein